MEAWRHLPATKEAFCRIEGKISQLIEDIRLKKYIDVDNADATQYKMAYALAKMEGLQEALNIGRE